MLWVAALAVSAGHVCVPDKVNEFSWEGCPPPWPRDRNGSLWYTEAQTPTPDYPKPCGKNCRCETGCDARSPWRNRWT